MSLDFGGRYGAWARSLCLALCALLLSACSTLRPWVNASMDAAQMQAPHVNETRDPSLVMAVTISGGGARAAAFGYGVLRGLDQIRYRTDSGKSQTLLEATDLISGVSGGSIVSAFYAAFGREELPRFESDFLRQDFQSGLISLLLHPGSLYDLSSPWFGRSNLLAQRLDELYKGMTFGQLEARPRHPQLIVTATDLTRGNGFEFTWEQFTLICSDLASVPLSFAVAASSAVPIALSPLTVKNYSSQCPTDVTAAATSVSGGAGDADNYRQRIYRGQVNEYLDSVTRPYIHLVDGGLADNLGVQRLLDRALSSDGLRQTFREVVIPPGSVRRAVLVVINAERDPTRNLDLSDEVPGIVDVADALLFGTGARATNETQEYLHDVVRKWKNDAAGRGATAGNDVFAPDAQIHVITVNLRDAPTLQRSRLLQVATAFSIPDDEVSELIEAGRQVLHDSPDFKALVRALDGRLEAPAGAGLAGGRSD